MTTRLGQYPVGAVESATTGRAGGMSKAPKRGHGGDALSCPMSAGPVGTSENSPAIHRGGNRGHRSSSPVGTIERGGVQSSLRDSDRLKVLVNPGINAWAMIVLSLRDERHGCHEQLLQANNPRPFETRTQRQSLFNSHRQRRWINEGLGPSGSGCGRGPRPGAASAAMKIAVPQQDEVDSTGLAS